MGFVELLLVALGLSMDAFAVSVCSGFSSGKTDYKKALINGIFFGTFQAIMPLIGFFVGYLFQDKISAVDHWVAFVLLAIIGINMIKESREESCEKEENSFNLKNILLLSIATSIDALAVGLTFALLDVDIIPAIIIIGIITFVLSFAGVKIGNMFGAKYKGKAELLGGIILILIGLKILIEHLGIFSF